MSLRSDFEQCDYNISSVSARSDNQLMTSYYEATAVPQPGPPLTQHEQCEVAIIGGGFAGLAVAASLRERGVTSIAVVESRHVGYGASGRNGGFIFGGYSLGEEALRRQHGPERARQLYQLTLRGGELIAERSRALGIDCDYRQSGVLLADWFGDTASLRRKQQLMAETYGVDWRLLDREETRACLATERYHGALLESRAAHFHPLKYCQGLARALRAQGVAIHEQSPVTRVQSQGAGYRLDTPEGSLEAQRVVVAAGGYIHGLDLPISRAILPIATYVAATQPLGERLNDYIRGDWAIYDTRFAFDYYRPLPDTRLLWGGRISIRRPGPETLKRWLRRDLQRVFPELAATTEFEYVWYGLMGYMRHQMPCIHQTRPGLWHLIGFGGHGVAPTSGLGELLAATLCGDDEQHDWFQRYAMPPVYGALGSGAAQLTYWRAQISDWIKDWRWRGKR
ncbi:MAG: FAD-binding oxidoreductase [Wenzhouxiangellaceae bacterium]